MVNTFVPFENIQACARALDMKRLGKQRVEAYQLWRTLTGVTKGWANHPATLMWTGSTCFLAQYTNMMIDEWVARGYRNTMKKLPHCANPRPPWWWGWTPIHMSHRAALNRKMPDFYHFEVGPYAERGYVWPSKVPNDLKLAIDPDLEKITAEL
jgi:Pyrimidine dimer DNA glycosylase